MTSLPDGYAFEKNKDSQSALSDAYEEMWTKIYPYFKCDRAGLENFFVNYEIDQHLSVIRKIVWYDVTPNKSLHEVVGYMNSISAY